MKIAQPVAANKFRILAQRIGATASRFANQALSPGQSLAVAVLALAGVAAFGLTPDTRFETMTVRTVVRALPVPGWNELAEANARFWREERIARGDTIG